jgi:hypothetical protein
MPQIALTKGYFSIVDDEDGDLAQLRWAALEAKNNRVYATRVTRNGPKKTTKAVALYIHREVVKRMGLDPAGKHVDHINGDTLDNRRANLRVCSASVNLRNVSGARVNNTSGHLGVAPRLGGWTATIRTEGRKHYLGWFKDKAKAVEARLAAERKLWGVQPRRAEAHR